MAAVDLFASTTRPEEGLFFRRNDPNDVRMGEWVVRRREHFAKCQLVLLGCPQDQGIERNRGRVGARLAPTEIRRAFYRLPKHSVLDTLRLFDLGDLILQPTLEATHALQAEVVGRLLKEGKVVLSLGGGNDIAYPDCKAAAKQFGRVCAFNIDAHLDLRADREPNSGTPYRQLLDEEHLRPELFHEVGIQPLSNSSTYLEYARERGISVHTLADVQDRGVDEVLRGPLSASQVKAIFWGFDLDSVRASDAPGVSAPSPIGLTAEQICRIGTLAGRDARTRLIEISEVNPSQDVDGRTSRLAALILISALVEMAARAGGGWA
ncbi:MAG TPA: formimidoylglutamase [Planctomycetota bacterium]|nr:formimidoylglutamase [Planctomycetota bacterium]